MYIDETSLLAGASSPPLRDHYDVVIVGGRVAGAATAHLLARFGLDVLVLDRGRYGADTLSTHALMRTGVLQLARWGLLDQVIAAGAPAVRRTTFRYGGETVIVPIKPGGGVDALYAPRRTVLDPILVDAAVAAGAEVRFSTNITGVVRDRNGRIAGVTGATRGNVPFSVGARLVIGADGLRSRIADLVGASPERSGTGASAVSYGYWNGLDAEGYEWNFRSTGCSGLIPTNDGATLVFVATSAGHSGTDSDSFLSLVDASDPELGERLAAASRTSPIRRFPGRTGFLRRSWGPGWALVGDAGYFKDPLSAHGITDSLRDAELLARATVAALDGEGDGAIAAYQDRRDVLSIDLFEITDAISRHEWSDEEIGSLLLRLNAAMAAELDAITALPDPPAHASTCTAAAATTGRTTGTALGVPA